MFAGILRGIGNSIMPLVFLIISSVINVLLDILLVSGFHMGIVGAAIATVASQLVSVICCIGYMKKKCPQLHLHKQDFKWDPQMAKDLTTMGLSMGMMFSVVSVGSIALQGAINSLGTVTVAAHTVARRIGEILMLGFSPLSVAASTYASQNLGAGKYDRIKTGIKATFVISFAIAIVDRKSVV